VPRLQTPQFRRNRFHESLVDPHVHDALPTLQSKPKFCAASTGRQNVEGDEALPCQDRLLFAREARL
jgi:hypothetical protein